MTGGVIANTDEGDRVATTVADARYAGARLAERDAAATDRIVEAVGERLSDPETISRLALAAANETRRGHSGAKTEKIATAVDGARSHLRETPTTGVIGRDEPRGGLTVARPVGVVGVAVPATHPVVVSAVVSLYALAGQNSVVLAPSPSAVETCDMAVEEIRRALAEAGAPADAVSMLPAPSSKTGTDSLFERVDFVVASGSAATVAAGQRCGTPNMCAGADGLVSVSDGSASMSAVATRIAVGATYDFGAHPAADAAVVTAEGTTEPLIAALEDEGGYVLDANECDRLRDLLAGDGTELSSPVGNSPRWFASTLDLPPAADATAFLIVAGENLGKYPSENGERNEDEDAGDDPLAALPGIPAVTIHACEGFSAALRLAAGLGGSHAAAVHTTRQGRVQRAAERLAPGRLVVNQPGTAAVGSARNGFPIAPLLGGGSREGSQLDGGLTATDLIETTSVSVTTVTDRAAHRNGAGETLRGP
ncbi:aldehyde dehydrogenase family protein [Halorubrum lacusprofundi]|uniref:Acetaldehyde dehydrogenase (Acetylating) NAD-dependent n=1 Tax=Halorubrum lacusprofundi (strain ATCC 49239 / DSM 5036 / JCM 8891 / ACAM 34) TaxID=416348 RepID=B9LUB0_HALLT|nr:aldehyde dehydrogenase family protein [Halorubrum lacusprofundi]ACM56267.1 acetaldehyde dehydrogenase (acetylating) NAD-dependent [Halorubrum lacusprofundi ATCC 49239]MCG1005425.1 aldehyde dehydrogenase family protein [Halorubrum lacusprofundi]